jgi:hypothetical protein
MALMAAVPAVASAALQITGVSLRSVTGVSGTSASGPPGSVLQGPSTSSGNNSTVTVNRSAGTTTNTALRCIRWFITRNNATSPGNNLQNVVTVGQPPARVQGEVTTSTGNLTASGQALNPVLPRVPGTYRLFYRAWSNNTCSTDPSGYFPSTSGQFITVTVTPVRTNPNLEVKCGLKVLLVLDESGSINTTLIPNPEGPGSMPARVPATVAVRRAANGFVKDLEGTGSEVAIVSFATSARDGVPYMEVTPRTVDSFTKWIDNEVPGGYNPSGSTNWQDAFVKAKELKGGPPELVVFVTDGDPNRSNDTGNTSAPTGSFAVMDPAVKAADALKATPIPGAAPGAGPRVLAIGVGAAVNTEAAKSRLTAVSGPTEFTARATNFVSADWTVVDFAELEESLVGLVDHLCEGSLTITKYEWEPNGTGWSEPAPGRGWTFTAAMTGSHTWKTPPRGNEEDASLITGDDGKAMFEWTITTGASAELKLLREDSKPDDFTFDYSTCTIRRPGESDLTVRHPDEPILERIHMPSKGFATCFVYNQRRVANLTVVKRVLPEGDPGVFNLLVDKVVRKQNVSGFGSTSKILVATRETHSVNEEAAPGTNLADYSHSTTCVDETTDETVVPPTASLPVEVNLVDNSREGHNIVCTITNTSTTHGNLTVIKHVPEGNTGKFNLLIDSVPPTPESTHESTNVSDGGSTGPVRLVFGTYQVSESGAAGTNLADYQTSITCVDQITGDEVESGTGPSILVPVNGPSVQCTITNVHSPLPRLAHLTVDKRLEPSNDPGLFDLLIGGKAFAQGVGNRGTTGSLEFGLGRHEIRERGAAGTNLANYSTSTTCVDETTHHMVASGTGSRAVAVDLRGVADHVVCTITNRRKVPAGGGFPEGSGTLPPLACLDFDPAPECGDLAAAPHLLVGKQMTSHARVGELAPITITVKNFGNASANHVRLYEVPSNGGRIVRASNHGRIGRHGTVVWVFGSLAPGARRTVHATMRGTRAGLVVNSATAAANNTDPAVAKAVMRVRAAHRRPPPPVTG